MKRVRCPRCDGFVTFDETRCGEGRSLILECPGCGKQFGMRPEGRRAGDAAESAGEADCGSIVVIENVFHYKQVLPLKMGDNTIGRYTKGCRTDLAIETNDPSVDITHCTINVSRDGRGGLRYVLRDGPSYTGTFVDNEILGPRERRVIHGGSLFTIGATSIILKTSEDSE